MRWCATVAGHGRRYRRRRLVCWTATVLFSTAVATGSSGTSDGGIGAAALTVVSRAPGIHPVAIPPNECFDFLPALYGEQVHPHSHKAACKAAYLWINTHTPPRFAGFSRSHTSSARALAPASSITLTLAGSNKESKQGQVQGRVRATVQLQAQV